MIENSQQQTPLYPPQRRNFPCATMVIVLLLLTACHVDEQPRTTPLSVTLFPTFTPTVDGTPPLVDVPVTLGITATLAAPQLVATVDILETTIGNMHEELSTVAPTATATIWPTITVSPLLTTQQIPTIPATMLTPTTLPPPTVVPTVALVVQSDRYIVQAGDTLSSIAQRHQTTVAALKVTNGLSDDLIYPDQSLVIPSEAPPLAIVSMPTPPLPTSSSVQTLSVLEGDLTTAYPLTLATDRFTLHYAPNPMPAQAPEVLADIVMRALLHHEQMLQVALPGRFDVYVAGAPFAPPDQSLRGHSYSADRFFVFLDDGSGNLDDLTYLIAHELTHMFVWLIFGRPTDPMLSEGAAVYVGMDFIAHAQHIPITTFCAAYDQIGALPWVSAKLTYMGHMRDLENYYAAGCFVKYLIETYQVEKFGQLYPSNDYIGIYGKTLAELDTDWHAAIAANPLPIPFDAVTFVQSVERLKIAHATLFDIFTGTAEQMTQYRALDQVRMALLEGRLADVQTYFGQ